VFAITFSSRESLRSVAFSYDALRSVALQKKKEYGWGSSIFKRIAEGLWQGTDAKVWEKNA